MCWNAVIMTQPQYAPRIGQSRPPRGRNETEKHASLETGGRRRSVLVWAKRGLGAGDEEVRGVGFRISGNEALGGWQPDGLAWGRGEGLARSIGKGYGTCGAQGDGRAIVIKIHRRRTGELHAVQQEFLDGYWVGPCGGIVDIVPADLSCCCTRGSSAAA